MARPIKNNAEYFSHDADMRNDLRIKAIRNKFGLEGYAMYCILLECMTDADDFMLKYSVSDIELLAADMGINPMQLKKAVEYMLKINLIQQVKSNNNQIYIRCDTLLKRFTGLLSKRKRDRSIVIDSDNSQYTKLPAAKTHKVKESKVYKEPQQKTASENAVFVAPTIYEVRDYFTDQKLFHSNPITFFAEYENKLTADWKHDALNYANGSR